MFTQSDSMLVAWRVEGLSKGFQASGLGFRSWGLRLRKY